MDKIKVAILHQASSGPANTMLFLAKLTQRGHSIGNMEDLLTMYDSTMNADPNPTRTRNLSALPHGAIKRFSPITIAIFGASRRFLAQIRTHQVGVDFVSASLQYSDYSKGAQFVVPYELFGRPTAIALYLKACEDAMATYKYMVDMGFSNDTAGYAAPQGLRNILILQANHQSLDYLIRLRACNRNTEETQYVLCLIWKMLIEQSYDGEDLFSRAGPDCVHGTCREGSMSCGKPFSTTNPVEFISQKWPLLCPEEE